MLADDSLLLYQKAQQQIVEALGLVALGPVVRPSSKMEESIRRLIRQQQTEPFYRSVQLISLSGQ